VRSPGEDAILPSDDKTVWFLTENDNKYREASSILAPFGLRIQRFNRAKVELQDPRLEIIARFALITALKDHRKPTLVEDSGLFIEALDGFPGPYSSFVYYTIGLQGIIDIMKRCRTRKAYFQSTVAFGSPSFKPRLFTGKVYGRISKKIVGKTGFGYDPIFIPEGSTRTFGQTSQSFKNTKSHRARAFQSFARWFVTWSPAAARKTR
jgi:XTP/dITP diphosphohydrolase